MYQSGTKEIMTFHAKIIFKIFLKIVKNSIWITKFFFEIFY